MIRITLCSQPINDNLPFYLGLYMMDRLFDYMQTNKDLNKLINWFYDTGRDWLNLEYNNENRKKIVELYHKLKLEGWEGNLIVFSDDKKLETLDFTMIGYDICADSMHYSLLGDGLLLEYSPNNMFFSEMTPEKCSEYRRNINDKWLFNSYVVALEFAQYCNFINKKHLHCIESEENWRPFAIYSFNQ